jgi:anti-anti-sigma factor
MDSTGLKVLLSIQRRADLAGGSFALVGVGRTVAKVLALTGLDQTFAIYETLAELPPAQTCSLTPPVSGDAAPTS